MPNDTAALSEAETIADRSRPTGSLSIDIRKPVAEDASGVHSLIAACPPLDSNSMYANLIQCTHFAGSCAIARLDGEIRGWISGHCPPERPDTFFLWQVAVHADARGLRLGQKMLENILNRQALSRISLIETSITRRNEASWRLFQSLSRWLQAPMREELWFDRDRHFAGQHDSEFLVTIGPFKRPGPAS